MRTWRMTATLAAVAMASALALAGCAHNQSETAQNVDATPEMATLQADTLTACLYAGFPPFASKDGDTWSGWDVDYLTAFAATKGLALKVVEVPTFQDIWMRPGNDECDVAGTGITELPTRKAQGSSAVSWTKPYFIDARALAVRKGTQINGVNDLAGKTVVVIKGSTADTDLTNRLDRAGLTNVTVVYATDGTDAVRKVVAAMANGPVAFGSDLVSMQALAKENPGIEAAWPHCLMVSNGSEVAEPIGFAVRTASTGLVQALNSFITQRGTPYAGGLGSGANCGSGQ